ncbi:stage III sporulation protein SpoIIIAB [uncultured Clostridium sp.]|uniref:stage III sporulation protein SpoIIIAB n=1 Tax=uncultured Clostridium sp. TaxID=59620 RepID=UPI0025FE6F85|nr:stage III sporulation protein SpoIIIAB [uncultured Clostridium sp.]
MLKLILACVLFSICSYIGFEYGEGFNNRMFQLREVLKSLIILQNDILYGSTPLPEALGNFSYKVEEPVNSFIKGIREKLISGSVENVYDGAADEYRELKDKFSLNESDVKVLSDFFKSLGDSGVFGQERIFSLALEGIRMNLKEAEEAAKRNVKLYRYLGVCIGAMLTIFVL